MYRVASILVCLFVASAAIAEPAAPKKSDGRKTVGIISAIGQKFSVQKIGIMVFGNDLKQVPIQSWGIDDLVASRVTTLIGKQYNATPIAAPKGAFEALEQPGGLFRDRDAEMKEILRKISASHRSDLYLVVTKGGSQYGNSNQALVGLGILDAGAPIYSDNVYLFALALVSLYDGRTLGLIKRQGVSMGQSTLFAVVKGPHRKLDSTWWPTSPQVASNEKLRAATRSLVEQSFAMTIPELFVAK